MFPIEKQSKIIGEKLAHELTQEYQIQSRYELEFQNLRLEKQAICH